MMSPSNNKETKNGTNLPRCGGFKTIKDGQANRYPKRKYKGCPYKCVKPY